MSFGGMPLFWLLAGTFLLGVLVMGWIKSFQIQRLTEELYTALAQRNMALLERDRTIGAANVVVDSERKINRAGALPLPGRMGVLLDDARVSPNAPAPGETGRVGPYL